MDEFTVIPALDLKGDAVVHAKSGNRADYRPIESPYGAADDPFAIARGLLSHTASPSLYIADLDAIAGVGNHFELVRGLSYALPDTALWIDAGFSDVADCAFWLPLGATLVIGSEKFSPGSRIGARFIRRSARGSCFRSISTPAAGKAPTRCSTMPRYGLCASSPWT